MGCWCFGRGGAGFGGWVVVGLEVGLGLDLEEVWVVRE